LIQIALIFGASFYLSSRGKDECRHYGKALSEDGCRHYDKTLKKRAFIRNYWILHLKLTFFAEGTVGSHTAACQSVQRFVWLFVVVLVYSFVVTSVQFRSCCCVLLGVINSSMVIIGTDDE
jgi:hypothetical protein